MLHSLIENIMFESEKSQFFRKTVCLKQKNHSFSKKQ